MMDVIMPQLPPTLARFILRLQRAVGFLIERTGSLLGCCHLVDLGTDIKIGYSANSKLCDYSLAVEIDAQGVIVNSMHLPNGAMCGISDVHEVEAKNLDTKEFYLEITHCILCWQARSA